MKKFGIFLLLFLCAACKSSSNEQFKRWMSPNGKLKVLATVAMIEDLVFQVGGEHVDTVTLIQGDLDPHSYQLVKGDGEKLIFADVIFYNGLGLEHGPSWHQYLNQNPKATGLGNKLQEQFPELILYDDRGQRDPHIWTDISLYAQAIPYIVEALSEQDPEHAKIYRSNGEKLQEQMFAKHVELQEKMHKVPADRRFLVTSHDAFNYFARAYLSTPKERELEDWHKRFAAPEGLSPDSQLSTTDVQAIIEHLHVYDIHVLFPESNVSKDSIRKIVSAGREKGLELQVAETALYGDAMGPEGSTGDTYLKMIEHNVTTISKFLNAPPEERS